MQDGFASTAYGRVHYLEEGSGAPLVLLHSNGCSAYEYEHVIGTLGRHRRVIAWDMPGHGDSDPITRHLPVTEYARAVIDLMDALHIGKASVAGSSIGGSICIALGARHAARIDRLIPVETPARNPEEAKANWPRTEKSFGFPTQALEDIAPRFRKATPELLQRWNIDRNKAGVKSMMGVMWALREYDLAYDMPNVKPKTLLVFGDRGPTIGKLDTFRTRMPHARVEVLKDCGHFPMVDDPAAFAAVLDGFLNEPADVPVAAEAVR
jgi:pimeloyl-ACP methyl ester carboxylesterase